MRNDDLHEEGGWKERLTSYLDDQMSPEEAREFFSWLKAHPAVMKEAEEARRVWALLGHYPDEPVPEGFSDRVLESLDVAGDERASLHVVGGGRWKALAIAASVAVVAGTSLVAWKALSAPAPVSAGSLAALEAVPTDLLDGLDEESLSKLASLSDEEFEALLASDPQDLTASAPQRAAPSKAESPKGRGG